MSSAREAIYKSRLRKWGYHRKVKREEVMTILRIKQTREASGKHSVFLLRGRPVDMKQIEEFARRQHIKNVEHKSLFQPRDGPGLEIEAYTPPPSPPLRNPPSPPRIWQIPEKLLRDVDVYIKGSFEAKLWLPTGTETIIASSEMQSPERQALHSFVGGIDTGCSNFTSGNTEAGGLFWRKAFREIPTLIRGSYHDILPNIIQRINDLHQRGHPVAAASLMKHVASSSVIDPLSKQATRSIYVSLAELGLDNMEELEERVMTRYAELFHFYLGPEYYNSFVMQMNLARRKINRGGADVLYERLPDLTSLDQNFGPSNRRPMDVIRTRVEVLYEHEKYEEMEAQANILLERGVMIENDQWQNLYFVIKDFYYIGLARYCLKMYIVAMESLKSCLHWIREFENIDATGLFDPEKVEVLEKLAEISHLTGNHQDEAAYNSQKLQVLESVQVQDDI
ncbi:hypothetical protein ONS95_006960 [Cadophora gregata]|uniref:uncharacterized protein n=1 Tax=Cadophora gregata TaxID=51156 RepID=UPI0026DBDFFB|nr:uncharacterized protein ONS95_006960 [Cadophora gregata]KAK0101810.1 hypothetical protein ONS95_006960 [Cadophora gregata]KAK0106174.1 hypothetical protein ONS96_003821 [Cadophora gregata f. sp. sojae]